MTSAEPPHDQRILLRAATSKDGLMTGDVLARAGISTLACPDLKQLIQELHAGAGALMIAEEAVVEPEFGELGALLAAQPPWSDLAVIVLARHGAASQGLTRITSEFTNVTVIERPMRVASLVSAASSALRARHRQYQTRTLLNDLRQADQRKTEFLATLAHELRNPLAPIRNSLELLTRRQLGVEEGQRVHGLMSRQIDHMVRLIDDLMEVSRITRNKIDMQMMPLSLGQVIADAVELSRPQIAAAGHALSVELQADVMRVSGDRVRLTQIFSNLLNNAAKYTPGAGHLKISALRSAQSAVVEVRDDGVGLAPDMLDEIFEMFVQVGGTSRLAQGGLGIGLTLVKSLVELHGGTVEAKSDGINRGATFVVTLPLLADATSEPVRDAPDSHPLGLAAHRHLLVVDDNQDAADSLSLLLEAEGADVTTVYSGLDALQTFEGSVPYDVAVLDIGMPGMDGCELAKALRGRQGGKSMKLVALTGWGQTEQRERIAAAGFDHHLLKPVNLKALLAIL